MKLISCQKSVLNRVKALFGERTFHLNQIIKSSNAY